MRPPASWASESLGWDEAPTLMGEREAIRARRGGLRLVAAPLTRAAEEAALQADATMYVLGVRVAENGASGVVVEWRYCRPGWRATNRRGSASTLRPRRGGSVHKSGRSTR